MKRFLLPLVCLLACACIKPAPDHATPPAYRFTPGDNFDLTMAERLIHTPQGSKEYPEEKSTLTRYKMAVVAVRPDGAAHLKLEPTFGQVGVSGHGRPDATYEIWTDRPRDPDNHSEGSRYIRGLVNAALHLVVDREGNWLRDFRGLTPPDDFLSRDKWPADAPGLTVYPDRFSPKAMPAFAQTFMPADWLKTRAWEWTTNLVPHPPMTGYIPVVFGVRLTKREGSLLTLAGPGLAKGDAHVKPPLGIIQQHDRTLSLELQEADLESRFDLEQGLPIECIVRYRWKTVRAVTGFGEVVSEDGQVLTFRLRRRL
ncbi:MAG TPA: hypothetical protein PK961_06495 [bacterium]|nr:hypothetical protein [bacterium]